MKNDSKSVKWHWISNIESADKLELSVLSIFETIFAVCIFIWLSLNDYYTHLLLSAFITPLFLLRTKYSEEHLINGFHFLLHKTYNTLALTRHIEKYYDQLTSSHRNVAIIVLFPYAFVLAILSTVKLVFAVFAGYPIIVLIKIYSIIRSLLTHPITSVSSIPNNWWRYIGCMDIFHHAEPIPGYELHSENYSKVTSDSETVIAIVELFTVFYTKPNSWFLGMIKIVQKIPFEMHKRYSKYIRRVKNTNLKLKVYMYLRYLYYLAFSPLAIFYFLFLAALLFVIYGVSPYFYRLAIKGSSIFYLPLLWIIHFSRSGMFNQRLNEVVKLSIFSLQRFIAVIILLVVFSKILSFSVWNTLHNYFSQLANPEFIKLLLVPNEIPVWQIAAAVNGIICWLTYFYAEFEITKYISQNPTYRINIIYEYSIRGLWFISAILSFYTISILIYNISTFHWALPPIGTKLFPFGAF